MTLEVINSFNLTNFGIIVFFKNVENGLPENTKLISSSTNLEWHVKARMLWMHSYDASIKFSNERESLGHINFGYSKDWEENLNLSIKNASSQFEYKLEPIGHNSKPNEGEILIVVI